MTTIKIEECLNQLNNLLIAAGRCQEGLVSSKIAQAQEQLRKLVEAASFQDAPVISLGSYDRSAYRIKNGRIEHSSDEGASWWETCATQPTYTADNTSARTIARWVVDRLIDIFHINRGLLAEPPATIVQDNIVDLGEYVCESGERIHYRIRNGVVEHQLTLAWDASQTFQTLSTAGKRLRAWVAQKCLEHMVPNSPATYGALEHFDRLKKLREDHAQCQDRLAALRNEVVNARNALSEAVNK